MARPILEKPQNKKVGFKMKIRTYTVILAIIAVLTIGVVAYANGPAGDSWVVAMMGRDGNGKTGGHGMMGGNGRDMMDSGQGTSNLSQEQANKLDELYRKSYQETEVLRKEIREKREELASLFRSDNPDKNLIDQKINELNRLESDLDKKMAAYDMEMRRILTSEPREQARNRGSGGMYYYGR
jgi:Spy/CpxP family protein refolding chaperone